LSPDFFVSLWFNAVVGLKRNQRTKKKPLQESDLQRWKLMAPFHRSLLKVTQELGIHPTFTHPQRLLELSEYLSLFLFGLLNPVVKTMRALCEASELDRVQEDVCGRAVSLGSFSEVQHVVEPALLEAVFHDLSAQVQTQASPSKLPAARWLIQDSTLWEALPRMHWAAWRRQGPLQMAVRLHLSLHLLEDKPVQATVTTGNTCERAAWRERWQPGDAYVGDRYYGENYALFHELTEQGCHYVLRLRESAVIEVAEELPLSEADQAARVVRQAWVRLGSTAKVRSDRVRVVWVQTPDQILVLVTNYSETELSAAMLAEVYKQRWKVELFFRWIKCILENRHWLAESKPGVMVQLYLALIASVLLQLFSGNRPSKRAMERIQLYMLGWATPQELESGLSRDLARRVKKQA
jgi:Transposase DDE domain